MRIHPVLSFRLFLLCLVLLCFCGAALAEEPATKTGDKKENTKAKVAAKGASHKGKGSSSQPSAKEISAGKALFKSADCAACHKIDGKGCEDGVSLDGIGSRRSAKFLTEQLKDPEDHVSKNQKAFGGDPTNLMPKPDLEPKEINLIVKYLQSLR